MNHQITTKRENYRRYEAGEFGNKLRTWETVADVMASTATEVVMRYMSAGGVNFPGYGTGLLLARVPETVAEWRRAGADESKIRFNERAPDERLTIQGELMRDEHGWNLFHASAQLPMRKGLALDGRQTTGLRAMMLLRGHLSPGSFEDIMVLTDRFPDSVIEFSAYARSLGSIPRRNAVIWEVRNY